MVHRLRNGSLLCDVIASIMNLPAETAQQLLEARDVRTRVQRLIQALRRELGAPTRRQSYVRSLGFSPSEHAAEESIKN
jgi:hypothetical protein